MSNPMIQTPDGTSKRVLASHFSTQFMMQKNYLHGIIVCCGAQLVF